MLLNSCGGDADTTAGIVEVSVGAKYIRQPNNHVSFQAFGSPILETMGPFM